MPAVKQDFTLPSGHTIELFYIGKLAEALGRTANTVRRWEIGGIIPDPCFRDKLGKRLYSQEQIDVIVQCAEKAGIMQGKSIASTSFSTWVHKELSILREKYKSKGGKKNGIKE
jgi:transcriptional regulator with XRE-family HTH domain